MYSYIISEFEGGNLIVARVMLCRSIVLNEGAKEGSTACNAYDGSSK